MLGADIPGIPEQLPPLPALAADAVWYYVARSGQTEGPVTASELGLLHISEQIDDSTSAWKEGMGEWKKVTEIEEVKGKIKPKKQDDAKHGNKRPAAAAAPATATAASTAASSAAPSEGAEGAEKKEEGPAKKKKKAKKAKWVQKEDHANVYVEGLPKDITETEMYGFFKRCGVIVTDLKTEKPRIKIYKNEDGSAKGSGLVTYVKPECVTLALQYLDDAEIRPGVKVKVTKAVFEMKGSTFQPKSKGDAKAFKTKKMKFNASKDLSWADEEGEEVGLRIVVLKGMFTPQEVQDSGDADEFYEELQSEVAQECEAKAGEIEKLFVFKGNPDGVITIKFKTSAAAGECIKIFHGRFFAGRPISCEYWDGVSNFKVEESEESMQARLDAFGNWLEGGEEGAGGGGEGGGGEGQKEVRMRVRQGGGGEGAQPVRKQQGGEGEEEEEEDRRGEEEEEEEDTHKRHQPDAFEAESDIERIQDDEEDEQNQDTNKPE